jgi:hypothetical protein
MNFKTEVNVIRGDDTEDHTAELKWNLSVETRSHCVKGLYVYVPDQTISVDGQDIELKDVEIENPTKYADGFAAVDLIEVDGVWTATFE